MAKEAVNIRMPIEMKRKIDNLDGLNFTQKLMSIIEKGFKFVEFDPDFNLKCAIKDGILFKMKEYRKLDPEYFDSYLKKVKAEEYPIDMERADKLRPVHITKLISDFKYIISENCICFHTYYNLVYCSMLLDKLEIPNEMDDREDMYGYNYVLRLNNKEDLEKCL